MSCCAVMDESRFRYHMLGWVDWHRGERYAEGFDDEVPVLSSTRSRLFEELVRDVDTWVAEVIEAEVNDLPVPERAAVHHVWLQSTWKPHDPLEVVYGRARDRLIDRLAFRGIE